MASADTVVFVGALALLAAWTAGRAGLGARARAIVGAGVLVAAFVPLGGVPAAGYVRAVVGDFSFTSLAVLVAGLSGRASSAGLSRLGGFVLLASVVLYPMALGLTAFDPYRLGFRPIGLLAVLLVVEIYAIRKRDLALGLAIVAAVAAYGIGLLPSTNLWDYLVDPWVALVSVALVVRASRSTAS